MVYHCTLYSLVCGHKYLKVALCLNFEWILSENLRAGSVLTLLASCQQNLYDIYHCCVYSEKFLIMDRGTVRNM